ncbi:MAG: hypothetical protein KUG68_10620 [Flavobacteriaceae bacterium]|nr:hypothetical protein [Flavobacteriaceae bacterium]
MSVHAQKVLDLIREISIIEVENRNEFQSQFLEQISNDGDLKEVNSLLDNDQLYIGLGDDVDTLSIDLKPEDWGLIKKVDVSSLLEIPKAKKIKDIIIPEIDIDIPPQDDNTHKMIDLGEDWGEAEESIDLGPDWED